MAILRYKAGSANGASLELKPGLNTLGRNPANQLVIDDPSVSGRHCEIHVNGTSTVVKDVGSTNGTYLEGDRIQECALVPGQTIQFGVVEMVFEDPGQQRVRVTVGSSTKHAAAQQVAPPLPAPAPTAPTPAAPPSLGVNRKPHEAAAPAGKPASTGLIMEKEQIEADARAKIFWGEATPSVIAFMRSLGMSQADATAFVDGVLAERAASVKKSGILKTFLGLGLMLVPVITFIVFQVTGFMDIKIFGGTCLVGAIGFWKFVDGLFMWISPRKHKGDLSED